MKMWVGGHAQKILNDPNLKLNYNGTIFIASKTSDSRNFNFEFLGKQIKLLIKYPKI